MQTKTKMQLIQSSQRPEAAFNRDISNSAKFVVGDFVKYVGKNGPPLNSTQAVVTVVKSRMSQGI